MRVGILLVLSIAVHFCWVSGAAAEAKLCESLLLVEHGRNRQRQLKPGQELNLIVWNLQKAVRQGLWEDLNELLLEADLAVLQESILSQAAWEMLHRRESINWRTAVSFHLDEERATGLSTGTRYHIRNAERVRSPSTEPIANTPKLSLISELPIDGRDQHLMLVNVHALNFVLPSKFRQQLADLKSKILHHKGPLIVAGDFNTHFFRWGVLQEFIDDLELTNIPLENDRRWLGLDHILVRGLEWEAAEILLDRRSSDHRPLRVKLKLPE